MPYKDPEKRRLKAREYTRRWHKRHPEYRAQTGEPRRAYMKEWYASHRKEYAEYREKNRSKIADRQMLYNASNKEQLLRLLGSSCAVCGESDPIVLQVDHIKPLLRAKREGSQGGFATIMMKIRTGKEDRSNLQVLCANCHARKTSRERQTVWKAARARRPTSSLASEQ